MREIAADAGAVPGLIRHHFGSKAGLTRAVDDLVLSVIAETLETAGVTAEQIQAFVPHQANGRINSAMAKHLGLPDTVAAQTINRFCSSGVQAVSDAAPVRTLPEEMGGGALAPMPDPAAVAAGFTPSVTVIVLKRRGMPPPCSTLE